MARLARRIVDAVAASMGLRVYSRAGYRFGMDWLVDLQHFPEGRKMRVALDVGANIGQTAKMLARAFPDLSIHSFEPVARTYEVLKGELASLPRAQAHRMALAEAPGEMVMTADADAGNRLVDGAFSGVVEKVPVGTIDLFCAEKGIERIDLLKIDVEGAEMRVLRGATESFAKRGVPLVLLECDFFHREYEPHGSFVEMFAFLAPLGYRVVSFYTSGVDEQGWRWGDVLLRRVKDEKPGDLVLTPMARRG